MTNPTLEQVARAIIQEMDFDQFKPDAVCPNDIWLAAARAVIQVLIDEYQDPVVKAALTAAIEGEEG